MPRTIKTVQLEDGSNLEVYADNCNVCNVEMIFLKQEADKLEAMFPFIKDKMQAGTPCTKCASELEKQNVKVFTDEEIEEIKNFFTNNNG